MTNSEMIEAYMDALHKLEKRHEELVSQIQVYDKRIVLLEEEMDEIWEIIAALRKYEKGKKYGWRRRGVSAGCSRQGLPSVLGL